MLYISEKLEQTNKPMETIIFQNKWCKIVNIGTYYVVKSKSGKYNDQYFLSADQAYKSIGIDMYNYNFSK